MQSLTPPKTAGGLTRRIKRHIIGPVQSFFAVTAPGLETLCRSELQRHTEAVAIKGIQKGGVAFEGRLHEIYTANLHCRTAHRFLMRVGEFKAETFDTLIQKTAAIPWELYLPSGAAIDVKVSAHRSRLYHSGAVAERVRQGIHQRMRAPAHTAAADQVDRYRVQRIQARLSHDRCQLSIDSSGSNLHKRGLKIQGGKAPLRETLAAAVLMRIGYSGREVLCDPMCGSGTFAIEAALMAKQIPPGWFREFAFQDWPAFREGRWRHIRRSASPPKMDWPQPRILASDQNARAVRQLQATLTTHGLNDAARAAKCAFEALEGKSMSASGGIVVLNPPYGRRLGSRRAAEQIYTAISRHLQSHFKGWKTAVLAPNQRLARRLGFRARRYVMSHGGQPVHVLVGKIPS